MNLDIKIIERVICNEATAEEQELYNAWISETTANEEFVKQVEVYYNSTHELNSGDIDSRWEQFRKENQSQFKKSISWRKIGTYASAAAVIAAALLIITPSKDIITHENAELAQIETTHTQNSNKQAAVENITITTESGDIFAVDNLNIDGVSADKKQLTYKQNTVTEVAKHVLTVPKGRDYQIALTDGTVVHMNANSELTYPISFTGSTERKVILKGEAFFNVAKDSKKQFVVEAQGIDIKVYGTKFNVNTNKVGLVETVLVEGSVSVSNAEEPERKLSPNQIARFSKTDADFTIENVDVTNYTSWITGTYSFFEENLQNITIALEQWYDIDIEFADEKAAQIKFVCNLPRNMTIDAIMNIIAMSEDITYQHKGNKIIISSLK